MVFPGKVVHVLRTRRTVGVSEGPEAGDVTNESLKISGGVEDGFAVGIAAIPVTVAERAIDTTAVVVGGTAGTVGLATAAGTSARNLKKQVGWSHQRLIPCRAIEQRLWPHPVEGKCLKRVHHVALW